MNGSPVDIIIFAPLAPIFGVALLWFIQLLFIEFQKLLLSKIKRNHQAFCRFTNFIGILFQSICHALGFTVTKSGIAHFKVTVDYGRVKPKKNRKGLFEWISNSFLFIGPFFLPALLILGCFVLINGGIDVTSSVNYTFAEGVINFFSNVYVLLEKFIILLVRIDLLHPVQLAFFILLVFLGLGIRPSYIGEDKRRKVDMMYDLRNIWSHITRKPLYVILLFLLAYVLSYLSVLFNTNWYVFLFSILGWLSVTSIVALFIAQVIILLIKTTDEIPGRLKILTYITLPLSYIIMRMIFFVFSVEIYGYKTISLLVMILSTVLVTFLLLYYKTNKFKTKINMKSLKKKTKET